MPCFPPRSATQPRMKLIGRGSTTAPSTSPSAEISSARERASLGSQSQKVRASPHPGTCLLTVFHYAATRMLQYSGRTLDRYSRVEASEAAAATASIIYSQSREEDMAFGGRRSRRPSFSNYGGSVVDPYAYDDYGGSRRARRASSTSRSRPIMTGGYNGYGGASPVPGYGPPSPGGMPIPGSAPPRRRARRLRRPELLRELVWRS